MKKLISFSLWGQNPKYAIGAIKNADLALTYYPEWICRFYCNPDVPTKYIEDLQNKKNVEVCIEEGPSDWRYSTKRFYPMAQEDISHTISRDADSRLGSREAAAVNEWLASDKSCHIMRDHPHHGGFPMLAGMFGIRKGVIKNIKKLLELNRTVAMQYHYDQIFLSNYIYPLIEDSKLVHDEFFEKKDFPTKRNGLEFVGQVFDENDKTVEEHMEYLKKYLENK